MVTFWEIISDGLFESDSRTPLRKPAFFFGDAIEEDDKILYDGDYKWLRQIGDMRFFLPNMERMYPLSYLQHMSVHRTMEWDLSRFVSGVSLDRLGAKEAYPTGHEKDVFSLFFRLVRPEYPKGETSQLAATFIVQLIFLSTFVRSGGSILPTSYGWVEWLDLFLSGSGLCCNRWGYTMQLGP